MLYEITPYVIGAAVSPLIFITTIFLLSQPNKPKMQTFMYFLGGLAITTAIGSFVFFALHQRQTSGKPSVSESALHILVGLMLLGLAVKIWRKKNKAKRVSKSLHYGRDILLGVFLMASDITAFAMFIPAAIDLQNASDAVKISGLVLLIVASLLPIWLPLGLVVIMGKKSQKLLGKLSVFMLNHGHQASGALVGAIALYVLYKGIVGL